MNPRKGMQRMLEWQQRPVDYNPPTFAKHDGKKEDFKDFTSRINKL